MFYAKVKDMAIENININGFIYTDITADVGYGRDTHLLVSVFKDSGIEVGNVLKIMDSILTCNILETINNDIVYHRVKEYEISDLKELPEDNKVIVSLTGNYCPNKLRQIKYVSVSRIPMFMASLRSRNELNVSWNIQIVGFKKLVNKMMEIDRKSMVNIKGELVPKKYVDGWEIKLQSIEVQKGES